MKTFLLILLFAIAWNSPSFGGITMFYPDGGEVLEPGTTYNIRWNVEAVSEKIDITLWDAITGKSLVVAENIPAASGRYEWSVPALIGDRFRIIITGHDDCKSCKHQTLSETFFAIMPSDEVLSYSERKSLGVKNITLGAYPNPFFERRSSVLHFLVKGMSILLSLILFMGRCSLPVTVSWRQANIRFRLMVHRFHRDPIFAA